MQTISRKTLIPFNVTKTSIGSVGGVCVYELFLLTDFMDLVVNTTKNTVLE